MCTVYLCLFLLYIAIDVLAACIVTLGVYVSR
jgi:hypothetical protein